MIRVTQLSSGHEFNYTMQQDRRERRQQPITAGKARAAGREQVRAALLINAGLPGSFKFSPKVLGRMFDLSAVMDPDVTQACIGRSIIALHYMEAEQAG